MRFEKRLATSFGSGRMWLAGDAAHLTGPAGVQSMNLGMAEARDFTNIMAGILRGGESLAELDLCSQRWTAEWRRLLGIGSSLVASASADPWLAACAPRLLSCLPGHGDELVNLANQLGLSFTSSAVA